jgi:predicted RNase H-like nuclease
VLGVGVDGAPRGWIAAACFGGEDDAPAAALRTEVRFHGPSGGRNAFEALVDWVRERGGGEPAPTAVDIPIGLMELGDARPCDRQARALLKGKASSVFNAPGRYLLEGLDPARDADYRAVRAAVERRREAEERAAARDRRSRRAVIGLGAQSAGILPKVREVNEYVRASGRTGEGFVSETWLFEVHPELCFERMRVLSREENSGHSPLAGIEHGLAPKTTPRGVMQRLALARSHFPDVERAAAAVEWTQRHGLYDVLDAYAALWTALRWARGDAEEIYGEGATEPVREDGSGASGLLMRIVV